MSGPQRCSLWTVGSWVMAQGQHNPRKSHTRVYGPASGHTWNHTGALPDRVNRIVADR